MTGLDIRFPIGLLFCILGLVLLGFGLVSDPSLYQRSLGININLWWGIVLTVAGATMLVLSRRATFHLSRQKSEQIGHPMEKQQ